MTMYPMDEGMKLFQKKGMRQKYLKPGADDNVIDKMREEETPDWEGNSALDSMAVNLPAGQWMPIKLLGIKESDRLMDELRKENFDLKLRIYFLQDGWREKLDGVQARLEQMDENIHDKETQIFIKDKLLSEKEAEIKSLESKLEIACVRSKTLEQDMLDLNQKFSRMTNLNSSLQLNMDKQLEIKNNLAGLSAPSHVVGDDTSPTETMGSGSNLHSKSFKAESHSKSNQDELHFNEVVEYQTACSTPKSSRSLQLFLKNERSCLGEDFISLSQPKRGNSAPEIISSPSIKDRSFQVNLDLQQLLEVKTKENLLLRSKLGLLDHVGEIDPKFVPDVNQLKKEVGDLKTELNKASDTIAILKQQISMKMKNEVYTETQCKSELIMRMAMEIKKLRKNRLCGIFGSGEQTLNVHEKENFGKNYDRHPKSRKEETLLKNETVQNNAYDTNNSAQRVKNLSNRITNKDMIISEQSKALDWYKNAYKMSRYPFKTSPPSINFTPNIYCGQKFTFYSEPKADFPCQKVMLKNQIAELKDQSELAVRKNNKQRQQEDQVSKRLNKRLCSSYFTSFFAGPSPMLAPQLIFSKKTKIKSPSNKSVYHFNSFTSQLNPLEVGCLNGNVSDVVTLLTQEAFMYASSFLHI